MMLGQFIQLLIQQVIFVAALGHLLLLILKLKFTEQKKTEVSKYQTKTLIQGSLMLQSGYSEEKQK